MIAALSSQLIYTENDAEDDSFLLIQQCEDLDSSWVGVTKVNLPPGSVQSHYEYHGQCLRFLKFAEETINVTLRSTALHSSSESRGIFDDALIINEHGDFISEFLEDSEFRNNSQVRVAEHDTSTKQGKKASESDKIVVNGVSFIGTIGEDIQLSQTSQRQLSERDASVKQLKRDIARDKLLVNGVLFIGANGGLEACSQLILDTINLSIHEYNELNELVNIPAFSVEEGDAFSKFVLQKAATTNSGSLCFETLQSSTCFQTLQSKSSSAKIGPMSTLGPPLKLRIIVSMYTGRLAIKCSIECGYYFKMFTDSDEIDIKGATTATASSEESFSIARVTFTSDCFAIVQADLGSSSGKSPNSPNDDMAFITSEEKITIAQYEAEKLE